MNVEQLMMNDVATCVPADSLNRAAQLMWERDCGAIPVLDGDGRPIAMLTDRDVCMASYTQGRLLADIEVASAMSKHIVTCNKGDSLTTAESIMRAHQIRRLPVVGDDGRIVGILSLNDIATHHTKRGVGAGRGELGAEAIARTLSAICARPSALAAE